VTKVDRHYQILQYFLIWIIVGLFLMHNISHASEPNEHQSYASFDGQKIYYYDIGEGPIILLLHGFTSNAQQNFFATNIAQHIAKSGYRVIAPDLRGHGKSQVIDKPKSWPRDAVTRDQLALLKHINAEPYAIAGYSFGAMSAVRLHLLSHVGEKLILGGVGDAIADENNTKRNDQFQQVFQMVEDGIDNEFTQRIKKQIKATGGTLKGYQGALSSRLYTGSDWLKTFTIPTLILTGDKDNDNGSGPQLADIIPNAKHIELEGTHLTAVADPLLPHHILQFLKE